MNGKNGKPLMRIKYSKEEIEQRKSDREYAKLQREYDKENRIAAKLKKENIKRELEVLNFMLKNDVKFYHHSTVDIMTNEVMGQITNLKITNNWQAYDEYIWNHQGEGNNMTSRCLLRNLWRGTERFPTIYDVPLDGTYKFVITDSGQRGLGSYNYMKAVKVEDEVIVPKVNPGAFNGF